MIERIIKGLKNTLIVAISFFMCLNMLHTEVFALEDEEEENYVLNKYEEENIIKEEDIAYELIERRDEHTRYFKLKNNGVVSCSYNYEIARRNENEEYELIDNTIKETEIYSSTNKTEKMIMELESANISDIVLSNNNNNSQENSILISKAVSQIVKYNNIYENTDYSYQLVGENTVNKIIMKNKECKNVYSFYFNGYEVEDNEDKIKLNKDEKTYYIEKIYAIDSNGNIKEAEVITEGNNITVEIDEGWLKSEEREYPVEINATVVKYIYGNKAENTTVTSRRIDSNEMYGYGSICVGREASSYEICQGVIKFELPQIKENEEVVSAYLSMYQMGFQGEGNNKVIVSPISEEVNIRTLTYRKLQGKISKGYDYLLTDRYSKNERFNIDITTIVREWINNDNNYGLVFTSSNTDSYKYTTFTSFSHPQYYSQYPYIIINTEDKEGIKDYYSYETTETIRSGSVYTNISNGNLVYVKEDFSDSGNYLPANVSHIYNHYGNENKGYGIKYDISCIGKVRKTGNNEYEYEDGYSSKSYFYLNENNEYVKEYDEKVKLKENENNIEIINNDIVYQFNKKTGLIEKITDKVNEKKQTYKYNEKNKIVEISDGAGRKSYFYYDENEMLSKIVYDVNKEIKYYYNENNQLIKIEDNDGNEVNYNYDDNNLLTEIRNENEGKIIIEYDEKNKKVKKVSRYNKVNELKEYYEVNYGNYETIITYDDGYKIRYQFDKNGQTVCVSDEKGNSYYYGYGEGNNKHNIKSKSMLLTESENILKGNFFGTYNEEADGSYRIEVIKGMGQIVDIQLNKEYILSFYAKGSFGCVKINEKEYKLEDIKEDEYQLYTFIYENKEKTEMRIDIDNIDKDKSETAELHSLNNNSNDLYIMLNVKLNGNNLIK